MESSATESEPVVGLAEPTWSLLDGEDPTSLHRDDPQHWVAVYTELVEATHRMLGAARERLASRSALDQAEAELLERDIAALVARFDFFTGRRDWWAKRGGELWRRETQRPGG